MGDVPEFREGKGKLAALEDRLQRRVEGRLGEALQVRVIFLLFCVLVCVALCFFGASIYAGVFSVSLIH